MASLNLSKLPWYGQLGLFVAIAAAGAGAFYQFYELKQQEIIAGKEAELKSAQDRIAKGVATARQLPEFRKQVGDLQARLDSLKPILPEEKDVGDLLRRIQTLATQSNLTIRGFRPQAITTKELHAEWPISLELEGTYHSLGVFLDRVSKFPRIINIGSLVLNGRQEPSQTATIDVSCTATTFVLVEPAVAPAAAPPGKKKGAAGAKAPPAAKSE